MNHFLIQLKVRKKEFLQFLAIGSGAYAAGIILLALILEISGIETYVTLGTMLAGSIFIFVHVFGIPVSFAGEFNMAVSMGVSRKEFVGSYAAVNLLEIAVFEAVLYGFGRLETLFAQTLFPEFTKEFDCMVLFQWNYLLALLIGMTVTELFVGAVILRYGSKALIVLAVLWFGAFMIPAKIAGNKTAAAIFSKIGIALENGMTMQNIFIFGAAAAAVLSLVSWNLLRKQCVNA